VAALSEKRLNDAELNRIRNDLPRFAREWDARLFASVARRVSELRPDIDLYAELEAADSESSEDLLTRLAERPDPIEKLGVAEDAEAILAAETADGGPS